MCPCEKWSQAGKTGMQFVDIPSGDLNMVRYVELAGAQWLSAALLQVMGARTGPLVVEAESAYRDLDATSAKGSSCAG